MHMCCVLVRIYACLSHIRVCALACIVWGVLVFVCICSVCLCVGVHVCVHALVCVCVYTCKCVRVGEICRGSLSDSGSLAHRAAVWPPGASAQRGEQSRRQGGAAAQGCRSGTAGALG